jgi:hypothetical protein
MPGAPRIPNILMAEDFSPLQVLWFNFRAFEQSINIYPRHLEPQACRNRWFIGPGF